MVARIQGLISAFLLTVGALVLLGCGVTAEEGERGTIEQAATVPSGFVDEVIASGLATPTAMALAPDGRVFVAQQGGQLRVVSSSGSLLTTPFLTVTTTSAGERGLLGVVFDPNFASNRFVYVYYTATSPSVHNRLSRFTASTTNPNEAAAGSEVVLLELNNLSSATNHNGGALHFGPDGKLYIAVGENANGSNAQTLNNLLGKMLRLNADSTIPSDNPFFTTATGNNRAIWALGLRNPFTFAFQPGTGRMFINDVGQNSWEEINDGIQGSNYGWPTTEGPSSNPSFRSPLFAYGHGTSSTTGCAITGGAFYNPSTVTFPASFVGKYFFADYCSNWIRLFDPATGTASGFATAASAPVDLRVSNDGSLWYVQRGTGSTTGQLRRIRAAQDVAPTISSQPQNVTVAPGQQATFSVTASGSQPLSYQWQRGTTNIAGATSPTLSFTAQAGDNGATFRVMVSNAAGMVTSNSATLTVTTTNSAPTGTITAPVAGTTYRAGTSIDFSGTGTDSQDGALPASAFTWEVVFHHADHTHPFMSPTSGISSGSFVIPNRGETATNVFYRIHLTVRDSGGLTHTTTRDILPQVANLGFQTTPAALQVLVDGQPIATPAVVPSVVGMIRSIGTTQQVSGTTTFVFGSWSDRGAATHEITTPAASINFVAAYVANDQFTACANEGATCSFSGAREVRYGANGRYFYRSGTGSLPCNNATFGDPIAGTVKQCAHRAVPTGFTLCSNENATCNFSGATREVRYGASGRFAYYSFTNGVTCNNATFGDPIAGTVKQCATR
jgi:glucose/arabinose dehydrogenase